MSDVTVWVAQIPGRDGRSWSEDRVREEIALALNVPLENVRAGLAATRETQQGRNPDA